MKPKFGLEKEVFLLNTSNEPCIVPKKFPHDDEGFQVEFRGHPHEDITEAVYSMLANEDYHVKQIKSEGYKILQVPLLKIPRDLKLKARRNFTKGVLKFQNLYSFKRHAVAQHESTAGIHLSITFPQPIYHKGKLVSSFNGMWDWVQFFKYLDEHFKEEIKESKRKPGFYELKPDGRIEYRSLPNTISMEKLISVVSNYDFFRDV